ncbi:hypothetical protein ABK040_006782 [Willaertia magna]
MMPPSSTTLPTTVYDQNPPRNQSGYSSLDYIQSKIPGSSRFWDYCYVIFLFIFIVLSVIVIVGLALFYHNKQVFIITTVCNSPKDIVYPDDFISNFWKSCQTTIYPNNFYYSFTEMKCMNRKSYGRFLNSMSVPNLKKQVVDNVVLISNEFLTDSLANSCPIQKDLLLKVQNKYKSYQQLTNLDTVNIPRYFKMFAYKNLFEDSFIQNNLNLADSLTATSTSWYSTIPELKNEQGDITVYGFGLNSKFELNSYSSVSRKNEGNNVGNRLWVGLNLTNIIQIINNDNLDLVTNIIISDNGNKTELINILQRNINNQNILDKLTASIVTVSEMRAELMLLNLARINSGDRANVMSEMSLIIAQPNSKKDGFRNRILLDWGDSETAPAPGILQSVVKNYLQSTFVVQNLGSASHFSQDFVNLVIVEDSKYTLYTNDLLCRARLDVNIDGVRTLKCNYLQREISFYESQNFDDVTASKLTNPSNNFYIGIKLDTDNKPDVFQELVNANGDEFYL